VVQAQEAVALASEQFINAQYSFSWAKGMLAGSLGTAEETLRRYSGWTHAMTTTGFVLASPSGHRVAAGGVWWWSTRNRESTDDAQVDAG
jgi:multidrug resistance efflux pump